MGEEEEGSREVKEELKPWEQHSGVISIPRFDYKAPSSLQYHSSSAFLVTCPFNREKSATKEVMPILHQFIGRPSISDESAKRRKVCTETIDGEPLYSQLTNSASVFSVVDDKLSEDSCESSVKLNGDVGVDSVLSLVKLIRSGLVLLTFPKDHSHNVVGTVAHIIQSLESGSLKAPLWCHRILPIQATCTLNEQELSIVVSKLVTQFVNDEGNKIVRPVKFAVAYNRRGFGDSVTKCSKATHGNSDAIGLLDRKKCFAVVAGAVKDVISDSVVDLTCPEISIFVEMLPLSRVPNASLVVGVSVLPFNLVTTKPKLCVKTLVSDTKTGGGKKNEKDSTVGE